MASRKKMKGRQENGRFTMFPHAVLNAPNFLKLSAHACKLLFDLAVQTRGNNNGDLCAAWTVMHPRGWKSHETLEKAIRDLEHFGFLERTRQGGRNKPNLYALTWEKIDHCDGKLDARTLTGVAPGLWKAERADLPISKRKLKRLPDWRAK